MIRDKINKIVKYSTIAIELDYFPIIIELNFIQRKKLNLEQIKI